MNTPYRKQFDKDGNLLNPFVDGRYSTSFDNRATRRSEQVGRLANNKKGIRLHIFKSGPFMFDKIVKVCQKITANKEKNKSAKVIWHSLLVK